MKSANIYLNFNGNCEDAFNFYKEVFGTEFEMMSRFSDMPAQEEVELSEEEKDLIMHISLPLFEGVVLMGSDTSDNFGGKVTMGDNFSISIQTENEEETKELFDKLCEGGEVKMPLEKTFWNAYFGLVKDKFGVQWMINCDL